MPKHPRRPHSDDALRKFHASREASNAYADAMYQADMERCQHDPVAYYNRHTLDHYEADYASQQLIHEVLS